MWSQKMLVSCRLKEEEQGKRSLGESLESMLEQRDPGVLLDSEVTVDNAYF